jgi:hypothetical protein
MKAHPLSVRLVLAAAVAVLGIGASVSSSGASIKGVMTMDTPLPAGWELCILQGVSAPATPANVADLDEWQLAEGGSTNNSAAFNPFNSARATDVFNTPLPLTSSANGFPAFTDWISGCAATVATILQPNMASIAAGLRAGNVSPPPAFLAVVDTSQWCAPSADGTPCYSDMIGGPTGSLAQAVLTASSALDVYGNVQSDLHTYQSSVTAVSSAQLSVALTNQQLSAADSVLSSARNRVANAQTALQHFAVNEYVTSGLYQEPSLGSTNIAQSLPSENSVNAHQYATFVAAGLLARSRAAAAAAKEALDRRNGIQHTLAQDESTLTSDNGNENRSLIRLVADVTTLQKAGACTTANITTPTPTPGSTSGTSGTAGASSASGTSSTPTAPAAPSTPASPATPTTTTTTIAPPTTTTSSTTTTTTPSGINLDVPTASTTTTTVPSSTTTTSAPTTATSSTTTTTTTVPSSSGSNSATTPAPAANPVGLQVLQGCVTALAPATSA